MIKSKIIHWFIITIFIFLYLFVSIISMLHVINFFELSNPHWMSVALAIAFEVGAAASLASIIVMKRMNKFIVWSLFILLTGMQAMGNMYYAYVNVVDFTGWIELFNLMDLSLIVQKRILAGVSGAVLPVIALGFIKALTDYLKPQPPSDNVKPSGEAEETLPQIVSDTNEFESAHEESTEETTEEDNQESKQIIDKNRIRQLYKNIIAKKQPKTTPEIKPEKTYTDVRQ